MCDVVGCFIGLLILCISLFKTNRVIISPAKGPDYPGFAAWPVTHV